LIPLDFEIFSKKGCFLILSGIKQFSPLLSHPLEKILKNSRAHPLEKILPTPMCTILQANTYYLIQRGPTSFNQGAIIQKRDKSRVTSNKMMYKTTDPQHLKLKKGR